MKPGPQLARRDVEALPEDGGEMRGRISDAIGCFRYGHLAVREQPTGLLQAMLLQNGEDGSPKHPAEPNVSLVVLRPTSRPSLASDGG